MPTASAAVPPIDLLRDIVIDTSRDLPLHAQVRTALERLIEEHFENDSRFFSESQLIQNLGVSQGTIRRALTDLAQRGMLEKRQARSTIVKKRSGLSGFLNLAIFLPDYSSPNAARFLGHLNAECLNRGVSMQPIYTQRGERLLKAYDNLRFHPREGGVVLLENSQRATIELSMALGDKGYECVIIDTIVRGESQKFVGVSNDAIIEIGLRHLYELGHRSIALVIAEPEEKESVQQRIAAFEDRAKRLPEPVNARIVHTGMHLWEDAYSAAQNSMDEVMASPDRPTAVFAVSDVGALGAMKRLQHRGYRIPEDVSVMGPDGLDLGGMVHPPLTSLSCPIEEMTQAVFKLLTEKNPHPLQMTFRPSLLQRGSTAPPGSAAGNYPPPGTPDSKPAETSPPHP